MTQFISIQQAMLQGNGTVAIRGWVHRERGSAKIKFIVLRDVTHTIQCVIEKTVVGEEQFAIADKLHVEASLEIVGEIKQDSRAPTGYEISVTAFTLIGPSVDFPLQKDQTFDFLLDNRHLALRTRKMTATLKIRSTVFGAIHEYFREQGFYEYQSPIFQATQAEGGSNLFSVDYFGEQVFLAQTWQLYAEPAIFSLEKIYTIAPSFRAEKSKTSRHLTEYWHAEMEGAWFDFTTVQDHGEGLLKHIVKKVLETNQSELKTLERDTTKLSPTIEKPFPRMTYTQALALLKEKSNIAIEWGKDLRTIEEDEIVKFFDTPIIVTHYPKIVKAFYMKEAANVNDEGTVTESSTNAKNQNRETVLGCDFLAPEGYGEIIGGSQREEDLEKIKERLISQGENPDNYTFYLDTRRYGSVPHGGFGMGVERVISWICGLDNIKDAIPFPRTMNRWKP